MIHDQSGAGRSLLLYDLLMVAVVALAPSVAPLPARAAASPVHAAAAGTGGATWTASAWPHTSRCLTLPSRQPGLTGRSSRSEAPLPWPTATCTYRSAAGQGIASTAAPRTTGGWSACPPTESARPPCSKRHPARRAFGRQVAS